MAVGNTYIGSTYRVLRQAAYAEVQRLWGEWRGGQGRSRRSALRRPDRKATVEALEPRQMLSVTASISGSSHVTESASGYTLGLSKTATGTPLNWSIRWGDGSTTTAGSAATTATHAFTDGTYTISASFSDTEGDGTHTATSTMVVTVDEACGSPCLTLSACGTVAEGSAYTIFTSYSEPGGENPNHVAAYFGDSGNSIVFPQGSTALPHTYTEPGCYAVTVVAYDSDYTGGPVSQAGAHSSTTFVNVGEANPSVSVAGLPSMTEGFPYGVTASTYDPASDTVSTYVVFWGDTFSNTCTPAQLATLTHSYAEPGNYTIRLVAFDEDHTTGLTTWVGAGAYSSSMTVQINEATPSFGLNGGGATTITEGTHYTPDLYFTDPAGDAPSYYVNWGQGGGTAGPYAAAQVTHDYPAEPGVYTATLQAVDEDGTYNTTVVVTVAEAVQTVSIDPVGSILPLHDQNFTVRATDLGGDVPDLTIDFGDNSPPQTVTAAAQTTVTHSYAANGIYTVTATAVDEDGTFTSTQTVTVTDSPSPSLTLCTATLYGASVPEGSAYSLYGVFADALGHLANKWKFHWGDGSPDTIYDGSSEGWFNHTYGEAGNYCVTATAYDIDGAVTVNTWANINEGPTTASAWGDSIVTEAGSLGGSVYTLHYSFTDPDLTGLYVDWGDGGSTTPAVLTGSTAIHAYSEPGSYCAILVGLDEDHTQAAAGNTNFALQASAQVTVIEALGAAACVLGTSTVTEGSQYSMRFAFSDPGGDLPTKKKINWGDGSTTEVDPNVEVFTHIYAEASGDYTITVTADTEDGEFSSTLDLQVLGVAPFLWINGATTTQQGADYSLSLTALYPPNDPDGEMSGSLTWTVDWGDGQDAAHPDTAFVTGMDALNGPVHHTYTQAGHYVVTATASDDDSTWGPVLLNGQLDVGFGPARDGIVTTDFGSMDQHDEGRGVALQPDGGGNFKIVAAGVTYADNGTPHLVLARYRSDGTLDNGFGDFASPTARTGEVVSTIDASGGSAMLIQPDGSILVAATSGAGLFTLARYIPDGTQLDQTFGPNHTGIFTTQLMGANFNTVALALQSLPGGDRIIVAQSVGGQFILSRYDMSGNYDSAFGTITTNVGSGGVSGVLAIDDNFNILIAGQINGQFAVSRYLSDGSARDMQATTSLPGGGMVGGVSIALQGDGKIVLAGTDYAANALDFALVRYNPDGTLDMSSFGTSGTGGITLTAFPQGVGAYALAVALGSDADGNTNRIVVAGTTATNAVALAGYTVDGKLDTTFGIAGTLQTPLGTGASRAAALLVQPDGKILLTGTANDSVAVLNITDLELARYQQDNTLTVNPLAGELAASVDTSGTTAAVDLAWTNNITNTSGVQLTLQRSDSGGTTYTNSFTVPAANGTYTDLGPMSLGMMPGTYLYRLQTVTASGQTLYSNVVTVVVPAPSQTVSVDAPGTGAPKAELLFTLNPQSRPGINRWVVNWGDGSAPQTVASNGSATTIPHTFADVGNFVLTATAFDAAGNSYAADPQPFAVQANAGAVASNNIAINFEKATHDIPTGYLEDVGHVYSDRGDYFSYDTAYVYGWNRDNTANTFLRGSSTSLDVQHDTFLAMQPSDGNRTWAIALDNGIYKVRIVAGDPLAINSNYQILANDVTVISGVPTNSNHWLDNTATVLVTNGRLTVSNGPGAVNNKIDFIEITRADAADAAPAAPTGVTAAAASPTAVDVHWSDNSNNESGFIIERSVNGGHFEPLMKLANPNARSYFDTGLTPSTAYAYRVLATSAMAPGGVAQNGPAASVTTPASPAEAPYGRTTPWDITGRIDAENFDTGGEGVAYHDDNADNIGGQYRNTGVDIAPADYLEGGYMVGWTHAGEWMNYTVKISQAGNYRLDFRLASSGPGGQFAVRVDGAFVANSISVPDTGGWGSYVTLSEENVPLPAGVHVVQLYMQSVGIDGGVANCDWFQAALMPTAPAAPEVLTAEAGTGQSNGAIVLNWQPPPSPTTTSGYVIERSVDGGTFLPLNPDSPVPLGTNTYSDTSPTGSTCVYRVEAVNGVGPDHTSAPSNLASIRVPLAGSTAVNSIADTSAWQAHDSVNYGATTPLYARGKSGSADSHVYLTFDTTAYTDPIGRVVLRLYGRLNGSNQTGVTVDVKGVSNTTWQESGTNRLTWATRDTTISNLDSNALGGPTLATATIYEGMGRWYEWDVTSYVQQQVQQGHLQVSFLLVPTVATSANIVFNSKEAATDKPALVLSPPATSSALSIDDVPEQYWLVNSTHTIVTHFHDPDPTATHTATVTWYDGTNTADATINGNEIDATHSYDTVGLHQAAISLSSNYGTSTGTWVIIHVVDSLVNGTISGTVWSDRNKDGLRNAQFNGQIEPPLANWHVYLDANGNGRYDPGETSASTRSDGTYSFTSVPPGYYTVRLDLPAGSKLTLPTAPDDSYAVAIDNSGKVVTGRDFGVFNNSAPSFGPIMPPGAQINPFGDTPPYAPATLWSPGDVFQSFDNAFKPELVEYAADGTLKRIWDTGGGTRTDYAADGTPSAPIPANLQAPQAFAGMAFAKDGSLVMTGFGDSRVAKMDASGNPAGLITTGDGHFLFVTPEFVTFDALGNMYVGNTGKISGVPVQPVGIYKFDPSGRLIDNYAVGQQVDWGDLAADQHTLEFTFEGTDDQLGQAELFSLDTNTGTYFKTLPEIPQLNASPVHYINSVSAGGQITQYAVNEAYALRFLPDGDALLGGALQQITVSGAGQYPVVTPVGDVVRGIFRIHGLLAETGSPAGSGPQPTITQMYATNISKQWFALNLDPDGTSFWSAGLGEAHTTDDGIYKFDIASGTLLEKIDTTKLPGESLMGTSGLTVYGERTAAIPVNQQYTYRVHATDPEQDEITYAFSGDSHGAAIDPASGVITWSPTAIGTFSFTVTATDSFGAQAVATFPITVSYAANGVDHAPVLADTTLSPAIVQHEYTGRVAASDADGDRLVYSLVNSPDFTIDPATGEFQWLPTAQDQTDGKKIVTIKVTDSRGNSDQRMFVIPVLTPAPAPVPVFQLDNDVPLATTGVQFTYGVGVNPPDGGYVVEFVPAGVPRGMTVSTSDGRVTWTPSAAQVGRQTFTVGAFALQPSDDQDNLIFTRVGYAQKTFTVDVQAGPLSISGVNATQVSPTTWRLDAVLADPTALAKSTFKWNWSQAVGEPPKPVVQDLTANGSQASILATFSQRGPYHYTVDVTNAAGTSTSTTQLLKVDPEPTRVTVPVPALVVLPGDVLPASDFAAVVYDQFGQAFSPSPAPTWTAIHKPSGGSFSPTDGTYHIGNNSGTTDDLRVSVGAGVFQDMYVTVSTQPTLVGSAQTGLTSTEHQSASFPLAYFYDSAMTAAAGNYTVSVDWGDGTSSSGSVVTVTAPNSSVPHLFLVSAAHAYLKDSTYAFTVHVTAPGSRTLTIVPDDAGVVVQDARIAISPQPVTPRVWLQTPVTTVATFTDASPTSSLSEFKALIDWGDGSDPELGAVVQAVDSQGQIVAGHYLVQGSHLFSKLGTPALANVQILEVDDEGPQLRASAPLQITVGESALPAVTRVVAVGVAPTPPPDSQPQIVLAWDGIPGLAGGYIVKRYNPDGTVITLPTPDASGKQKLVTDVPWADTNNLKPDTRYGYQVITTDPYGNQADPSPMVYATTWPDQTIVATWQDPPASLESGTHVHLKWNSPTQGLVWDVLRAKDQGQNTLPEPQFFSSVLGSAPPVAGTEFVDMTASANTEYWYEVVAVEPFDKRGRPAAAVSITTGQPGGATQVAPTHLTAGYAGDYHNTRRIGLQWDAPAGDALLGFDVYRGTKPTFTLDATSLIGSSADARYTDDFPDTVPVPDGMFYYAVKAVSVGADGGEISSAASNVATVNIVTPSAPPAAPTGLLASATPGQGSIPVTITWNEPRLIDPANTFTNRELGFEIRRSLDNGSGPPAWGSMTYIGLATQDATSFVDTTAVAGMPYYYAVASYDVGTQAGMLYPTGSQGQIYNPSSPLPFSTPATGPAPTAPQHLREDAANTTFAQIALSWDTVTSTTLAIGGYYVYRSTDGGQKFFRLDADAVLTTSYTDTAVTQGAAYVYQVTAASDQNSQSSPSAPLSVTAPTAPDLRPVATITSPAPFDGINFNYTTGQQTDGRLRVLTPIRAQIYDPNNNLTSWSLVLRPANVGDGVTAADIPLASGNTPQGVDRNTDGSFKNPDGAILYTLDPTLYPSGDYQLILTATDATGAGDPAIVPVSLFSQTKLGNLTLPVTDLNLSVPGGAITVSRVYDSQNANVLGDLGYGWRLDISDTSLRTTARPGTSERGSGNTLRPGDQVYLTLPGGQQHAFQFWPVPSNYTPGTLGAADPYGLGYFTYYAQFVCVDGSNATLRVEGDLHDPSVSDRVSLEYDKLNNEFHAAVDGQDLSYDPGRLQFGGYYEVQTQAGAVYHIDASSGSLMSSKDPNGNLITYNQYSVTGGQYQLTVDRNPDGTIHQITILNSTIKYNYASDTNPLLTSVTGRDGLTTHYEYGTITIDGVPAVAPDHYLTRVTDPRGVATLTAQYETPADSPLSRLKSLTDAKGNSVPLSAPSSDGSQGSQGVTAPSDPANLASQNNKTEAVYDDHGDAVRQIQTLTDSNGITGYSVTVSQYGYYTGDLSGELGDVFHVTNDLGVQPGESSQNALIWQKTYAPFVIAGMDAAGLRYTQAPGAPLSETDFDVNPDNGQHLPSQQIDYLPNGDTRVTAFTNYTALGMPEKVRVTLHHGGSEVQLSYTRSVYDTAGNLRYSFNAAGEGTEYVYSTGTDTDPLTADDGQLSDNPPPAHLPKGLLLATYRVNNEAALDDGNSTTNPTRIDGNANPLSQNTYYRSTTLLHDGLGHSFLVPPSFVDKLRSTIDANGQETRYLYDSNSGEITCQLTAKTWTSVTESSGVWSVTTPTGWVGTLTTYDPTGLRPAQVSQVSYDGATLFLDQHGAVTNTPILRSDLVNTQTAYDAAGQVKSTTDALSSETDYTYDADKAVVRTVYDATQPVKTETLTVYDDLGRVSWVTDRFLPGTTNAIFATHTVYDALGRVVETDRYQGTQIDFTPQNLTVSGGTITIGTTTLISAGTLISWSKSHYDDQGRVTESANSSGLRTGTVFYSDGRVQFSGVLKASAVDIGSNPWWIGTDTSVTADNHPDPHLFPSQYFSSYSENLYDQIDTSTGKPYSGLVFDRMIDPDGNKSDSYKDSLGRAAFTVYDDGSFTQTLYGVGKSPVPGHDPTSTDPLIAMPGQVIDGYQVTRVDAMGNATDSFYDHAGHLTDVWLPAVADAKQPDPNHPGQYLMARPHWHYAYDASGNETSQTDPDGHTTTFAYDEQGHQVVKTLQNVATIDPNGQTTRSLYDIYGRLLAVKLYATADPAAVAVKTTTYRYDNYHWGRVTDEYRFNGDAFAAQNTAWAEATHYTYDDDSSLLPSEQLAQGRVAQVAEYTATGGNQTPVSSTHTVYDPVTGQPSVVKSNEATPQETDVHHVYDPATGRLTETWTGTGTTNASATTDTLYGYDVQGRLASVTVAKQNGVIPSQTWSGNRFDATGNAVSTTLPTTLYSYDAAGNTTQVLYPNGTETDTNLSNLWNPTNPTVVVTNKRNGDSTVLSSFTYTFNADRQKVSSLEHVLDVGESTFIDTLITWKYDAENRLTKEIYDYGNDDSTTTNTGHTADDYTTGYVYDLAGNRKVQTQDKGNDGSIDQTTTFTYDNNDELKDQLVKDAGGATVSHTISTYVNGSLESEAVTTGSGTTTNTYGYDLRERMISATVNGQSFAYAYDSDGNRVSETTAPGTGQASTTTYLQDTVNPTGYSQVLEQWQGGSTPAISYVLGASVIAQNANGTNSYLMPDGHGSTRQLTAYTSSSGTSGHVTGRFDYDAFGNSITFTVSSHPANTADTAIRYTGELWDAGSGTYDLRARDYRPDLGRFSTSDSITITPGDLGNTNLYLYVANDPLNMTDPTGHEGDLISTLGALAVKGVLNGLRLGAIGAVVGGGIGAIDAALGGEDIVQGAIGGAKFGAAIGFSIGFLSPFATTFLAPSVIAGLTNLGAGASLALGAYGGAAAYVNGNTAQGIFRVGLGFLGYSALRSAAAIPLRPVNIGGEGEVPNVINLQPRSVLGKTFGRATDGKSLAGMISEGNDFLIYNEDTGVLPFEDATVPEVITNNVPIDTPPGGLWRPITSAEIARVLKRGGRWVRDGKVVYTKP